jgi:hypothetical protein
MASSFMVEVFSTTLYPWQLDASTPVVHADTGQQDLPSTSVVGSSYW